MLFIHFLLWECMPYFHNGVGLCQKSFLLEAGTLPTKYKGVHGTKRVHVFHPQLTSSTQHSSLDHPWQRPSFSPPSQPLCSGFFCHGVKKEKEIVVVLFLPTMTPRGSGLLPVLLWRNCAEVEGRHVPHQSSFCRCCPHEPAANKR